jgi:hypothetical protein
MQRNNWPNTRHWCRIVWPHLSRSSSTSKPKYKVQMGSRQSSSSGSYKRPRWQCTGIPVKTTMFRSRCHSWIFGRRSFWRANTNSHCVSLDCTNWILLIHSGTPTKRVWANLYSADKSQLNCPPTWETGSKRVTQMMFQEAKLERMIDKYEKFEDRTSKQS